MWVASEQRHFSSGRAPQVEQQVLCDQRLQHRRRQARVRDVDRDARAQQILAIATAALVERARRFFSVGSLGEPLCLRLFRQAFGGHGIADCSCRWIKRRVHARDRQVHLNLPD